MPMDPAIKEYYGSLLSPHLSDEDLAQRLIVISVNDTSPKPLAQKVLDRPNVISRIKSTLRPGKGLFLAFTATKLELEIATELDIPTFGIGDAGLEYWGSKSGSREIFTEAEIPQARGIELCHSQEELAEKMAKMHAEKPIQKLVVKLNEGFSGHGNSMFNLTKLGKEITKDVIVKDFQKTIELDSFLTWELFTEKLKTMGAIAEEFLEGESPTCPSVQGCIGLNGKVEILSTHEQVMNGQIYQGCVFPCSDSYRLLIQEYGTKVGEALSKKNVKGHFGVDFLVRPAHDSKNSKPEIYALEINLRQCGTTHPFLAMKFLSDGKYDVTSGMCNSSKGVSKFYTHSDNLHKDEYIGILPTDLFELCESKNLNFDPETQCGPVFHMLGALSQYGKVGVTCIEDTKEKSAELAKKIETVLDELAANLKAQRQESNKKLDALVRSVSPVNVSAAQ